MLHVHIHAVILFGYSVQWLDQTVLVHILFAYAMLANFCGITTKLLTQQVQQLKLCYCEPKNLSTYIYVFVVTNDLPGGAIGLQYVDSKQVNVSGKKYLYC